MTVDVVLSPALLASRAHLLDRLCRERIASRIFDKDASIWGDAARSEASVRLGWVDPFDHAQRAIQDAESFRTQLNARAISRVVLCGMGGSSLGAEVIAREAGVNLVVLDSTHPAEIQRAMNADLASTVVVVSSKSGTTLETLGHEAAFAREFKHAGLVPNEHICFITDPGSPLSERASDGYQVFLADPTIGGRFSALTAFGLVPAVLAGADGRRVLEQARRACHSLRLDDAGNPALNLAAALASGLPEQFVVLMHGDAAEQWGLGDWIEQLIAESTGKLSKGILPIALPADAHELSAPPPNAVTVRLAEQASLSKADHSDIATFGDVGSQFLAWEVATAALGYLMGINPFDQPDVESSKLAAKVALHDNHLPEQFAPIDAAAVPEDLVLQLRKALPGNGYLAIHAFVDRQSTAATHATELRQHLAQALGVPVSLGWGPRYLHSVGQLHKGGPKLGAFLQLLDAQEAERETDVAIPGSPRGFGALIDAQSRGDREVLASRGNTVVVRQIT